MKEHESKNSMVTYFLEELCLQVKNEEIERAFAHELVSQYQKVIENGSEVLKKFAEKSKSSFKLHLPQE